MFRSVRELQHETPSLRVIPLWLIAQPSSFPLAGDKGALTADPEQPGAAPFRVKLEFDVCRAQEGRAITSSVDVAEASNRSFASTRRACANAVRRPIVSTEPMALTVPVSAVIPR